MLVSSSTAEHDDLDDNQGVEDEEENDQPLDLTVKRTDGSSDSCATPQKAPVSTAPDDLTLSARDNGLAHPKKRSWIKVEEEDDSFPHEIEEWKKTFAVGLCG